MYVSLIIEIDLLTLSLSVGLKLPPFINPKCGQMVRHCPDTSKKGMTLVCKSAGIWDGIVNPIFGCLVEIIPDINPIYFGLEMYCPGDSKNVSYVSLGLV